MKKIVILYIIICNILIGISCNKKSEHLKDYSKIENRIFDNIELLKQSEKNQIFAAIHELETNVGSQIAILIIDTLGRETLEQFSLRNLEELNLGRKKFKDGILVTVVYKEHKIRIEVGYGLENIVKDDMASRLVREEMVPKFREQKYFEGIYAVVNKIKILIERNKQLVGQPPL